MDIYVNTITISTWVAHEPGTAPRPPMILPGMDTTKMIEPDTIPLPSASALGLSSQDEFELDFSQVKDTSF